MPGCIEDSKAIMRFVAKELSTHTYVNLMDQYYPAGKVDVTRYAALNRCITRDEYEEVLAYVSAMVCDASTRATPAITGHNNRRIPCTFPTHFLSVATISRRACYN